MLGLSRDPMDCSLAGSSVLDSWQKHWRRLPFPIPADLTKPGIRPASLVFPALVGRFFTTSATWEANTIATSQQTLGGRGWSWLLAACFRYGVAPFFLRLWSEKQFWKRSNPTIDIFYLFRSSKLVQIFGSRFQGYFPVYLIFVSFHSLQIFVTFSIWL